MMRRLQITRPAATVTAARPFSLILTKLAKSPFPASFTFDPPALIGIRLGVSVAGPQQLGRTAEGAAEGGAVRGGDGHFMAPALHFTSRLSGTKVSKIIYSLV